MQTITASFAKQNFGQALLMSAQGPVRIERHRKTVAGLVSPRVLDALEQRDQIHDERRTARQSQMQTEQERVRWHQRLAIHLLCVRPHARRKILAAARGEVQRWQDQRLCSPDYIHRWRQWLQLDVRQLAQMMCGDAGDWGTAMRQNSPFRVTASGMPGV